MMRTERFFRKIKDLLIQSILPLYCLHKTILVWRLRRKEQINVVFFAMSVSMWRYQNLYEEFRKYPRFNVSIVLAPSITYSVEQQNKDIEMLKKYFDQKGIKYIVGIKDQTPLIDLKQDLQPDILFYPQPYRRVLHKAFDYPNFLHKLLCYYPYAFWMSTGNWSFNQPLHYCGWRVFYSTTLHKKEAEVCSLNRGRNVEVVGYPNSDNFLFKEHKDVWKMQKERKKRLIWAPHFSIVPGGNLEQSNFLWMADIMLELAQSYKDRIQFAFKPHPRLFTELCNHPDWGEKKALSYYEQWNTGGNTQLETGEFIDLFMTSDAMIHDSGSFCVEYHYTQNPVMYMAKNFEEQVAVKSQFGKLAMQQQYVGKDRKDILSFVEEVVMKGNDYMKEEREKFVAQYLVPPHGKTVAENTIDVFLKNFC